ncbi:MAG TPA: SAM-dependent methyltransferase, partial [Methylovirgula sp.]
YAVDVGRGQLAEKLRKNPRVTSMEATDARSLSLSQFAPPPNFVTCDVSFISLRLVLPKALAFAAPGTKLVALIKPQFEAGPQFVVKGLVKDEAKRREVCEGIRKMLQDFGWTVVGLIPSPIAGSDGNREFLVGATK